MYYWWLVTKLQVQQLVAAVIVGFVVAVVLSSLAKHARVSCGVRWSWFGLLARRLPKRIVCDMGLLGRAFVQSIATGNRGTGAFRRKKFEAGGTDARSAGRRALVLAGVSLPPNTFAVSVEGGHSLEVHQLVFQSEAEDREWPV